MCFLIFDLNENTRFVKFNIRKIKEKKMNLYIRENFIKIGYHKNNLQDLVDLSKIPTFDISLNSVCHHDPNIL